MTKIMMIDIRIHGEAAIYFFLLLLLAFFLAGFFGTGQGEQACLAVICFRAAAPTSPEKNAHEMIPIKYATCLSAGSFITRKNPDIIMKAISESEKYK